MGIAGRFSGGATSLVRQVAAAPGHVGRDPRREENRDCRNTASIMPTCGAHPAFVRCARAATKGTTPALALAHPETSTQN